MNKRMQVNITHGSGKLLVDCYGLFDMVINGHSILFCLTDNADGTLLEITEYISGLRWPISLEEKGGKLQGLASPADYMSEVYIAILAKAKQRILTDLIRRTSDGNGTQEDVATVILRNQKQYKANEIDF